MKSMSSVHTVERGHSVARALPGLLFAAAFAAVFAALAIAPTALGDSPKSASGKTVLVVGDSISAAYGLQTEAGERGWVELLAERLGNDHRVVNASISGDTTGGGLARLPKTLEVHEPDIVVLELGGNDGLRGYPIYAIRENLARMTEAVIASGATPVIAGMQMTPNLGPRYTQAFADLFVEVAAGTGAALVPFLLEGVVTAERFDELMQRDGIHPNAKAQPLLLDNVWPVLEPLLAAN